MQKGLLGTPRKYGPLFLYRKWDPYAPDEHPHSASCEFTVPEDLKRWTGVNVSGVSNLTIDVARSKGKGLYMNLPSQNYRFRAFVQALPGDVEFSIFLGVTYGGTASGGVMHTNGLILSTTDATNTGSQFGIFSGCNSDTHLWRGSVAWNVWGETASGASSTNFGIWQTRHLRMRKKAGTWYMGYSNGGEHYYEYTSTITGITPAFMGLYAHNYTGAGPTGNEMSVGFDHFRYYPDGSKKKSGRIVSVYR